MRGGGLILHALLKNLWATHKLPQICTVIFRIRIGKVVWFAVYICGNHRVTQYYMSKKYFPISYGHELYHIPCVQEVVTPFYIVSYYIKWGNYFLDTQYLEGIVNFQITTR